MRVLGPRFTFALIPILFSIVGCGGGGSNPDPSASVSPSPSPSPVDDGIINRSISPDGTKTIIARYSSDGDLIAIVDLYLIVSGSPIETLIEEHAAYPVWSTDSKTLAFMNSQSKTRSGFTIIQFKGDVITDRIKSQDHRDGPVIGYFDGSTIPISFSSDRRKFSFKVRKELLTGGFRETYYDFDLRTTSYHVTDVKTI